MWGGGRGRGIGSDGGGSCSRDGARGGGYVVLTWVELGGGSSLIIATLAQINSALKGGREKAGGRI